MSEPNVTNLEEGIYFDYTTGITYEFALDHTAVDLIGPGVTDYDDAKGEPVPMPFQTFKGDAAENLFRQIEFYATVHDRAFEARVERFEQNESAYREKAAAPS